MQRRRLTERAVWRYLQRAQRAGDDSSERRCGDVAAAREAGDAGFDVLIACAFNYEGHTTEFNKLGRIPVLKARMNPDRYGGAPLLGVKGVVIICHGRSNDNAIRNAIRVATESAAERVNARIESEIARWQAENGQLAAS